MAITNIFILSLTLVEEGEFHVWSLSKLHLITASTLSEDAMNSCSQTSTDNAASHTTSNGGVKTKPRWRKTKEEVAASQASRNKKAIALNPLKTGNFTLRQIAKMAYVSLSTWQD